jgi:hypothetical protein
MATLSRNDKELIRHVMWFGKKTEQEAIEFCDQHCGDWRGTPLPKAKRLKSIASSEKEWEE